jgi:hypothetical protein
MRKPIRRLAAQRRIWLLSKAKEEELKEELDARTDRSLSKSTRNEIQRSNGRSSSEYGSIHDQPRQG